jgi:hypothetical protein
MNRPVGNPSGGFFIAKILCRNYLKYANMLIGGSIMNLKKVWLIIAISSSILSSCTGGGGGEPPKEPAPAPPKEEKASAPALTIWDPRPAIVESGGTKGAENFASVEPTSQFEIDKHLKEMIKGNIAFSYPAEMEKDEVRVFKVKIGINKSQKELMEIIKAEGVSSGEKIVPDELKVSEIMVATLTGIGFKIDPPAPIEQPISETEPTSWEWQIQALKEGKQTLTLKLEAVFLINPESRS